MANDLQSFAHTKWNCKYHTLKESESTASQVKKKGENVFT